MRGAVFHEMGKEEITYHEDVEVSDPGPGEVRVRIHAAGVCHSDLSAMNGTLPQPLRRCWATRARVRSSPSAREFHRA
jgi:S-(hydroxymethyl)glutathione dehydrogenase / alcohol dehydrogenase